MSNPLQFEYTNIHDLKLHNISINVYNNNIYIPILVLASKIWKDEKYITPIREQSTKEGNEGKLYMIGSFSFVLIQNVLEYLEKYCHEDQQAKIQLHNFDFNLLEQDVRDTIKNNYQKQIMIKRIEIEQDIKMIQHLSKVKIKNKKN
jgi:hypothetical protein